MEEKRRFSRIACDEKIFVEFEKSSHEARILDISLKGALVELTDDILIPEGYRCNMELKLSNSDITLQFHAEVVHSRKNLLGVRYVHIDLDTMIHLRAIMEARTANPQQVTDELAFLIPL